jgi:hypothetical protein
VECDSTLGKKAHAKLFDELIRTRFFIDVRLESDNRHPKLARQSVVHTLIANLHRFRRVFITTFLWDFSVFFSQNCGILAFHKIVEREVQKKTV